MDYPISYIYPIQLRDGTLVQLRPIHPSDGKIASCFRSQLSDKSIQNRFLGYIPSASKKLINRLTKIDYDHEMAIVAEVVGKNKKVPVAVARIVGAHDNLEKAEFALIIADKWQGKGIGSQMTDYMIRIAREMGFKTLYALLYAHNTQMKAILKKRAFIFKSEGYDTELGTLQLNQEVLDIT